MRVRLLISLVVILSLVWVGGAVAGGVGRPGGDPDIWERAKVNNPNRVATLVQLQDKTPVVVDFGLFTIKISRQEPSKSNAKTYVGPLAERTSFMRR